jgi:hypothetical protein
MHKPTAYHQYLYRTAQGDAAHIGQLIFNGCMSQNQKAFDTVTMVQPTGHYSDETFRKAGELVVNLVETEKVKMGELPFARFATSLQSIIFCLLSICLLSCTDPDLQIVDPELRPHFFKFQEEAAKRHKHIEMDYTLVIKVGDLKPNKVGYCDIRGRERTITIDSDFLATESFENVEKLMAHECGHCLLNRGHLNTLDDDEEPLSLMSTEWITESYYRQHRERYWDELMNKGIAVDGNGRPYETHYDHGDK